MPIIARRPLLTSARSDFSFCSGVIFLVKPTGSQRLRGTGDSPHISRKPTKPMICSLAADGSASHWSPGPPAAEMSEKVIVSMPGFMPRTGAWSAHGKQTPLDWSAGHRHDHLLGHLRGGR